MEQRIPVSLPAGSSPLRTGCASSNRGLPLCNPLDVLPVTSGRKMDRPSPARGRHPQVSTTCQDATSGATPLSTSGRVRGRSVTVDVRVLEPTPRHSRPYFSFRVPGVPRERRTRVKSLEPQVDGSESVPSGDPFTCHSLIEVHESVIGC